MMMPNYNPLTLTEVRRLSGWTANAIRSVALKLPFEQAMIQINRAVIDRLSQQSRQGRKRSLFPTISEIKRCTEGEVEIRLPESQKKSEEKHEDNKRRKKIWNFTKLAAKALVPPTKPSNQDSSKTQDEIHAKDNNLDQDHLKLNNTEYINGLDVWINHPSIHISLPGFL